MGLDMYLKARSYLSKHNAAEDAQSKEIQILVSSPFRVSGVELDLGYWRKANHIHGWFVRNVQDGKDECQEAYVSRDKLKELLAVITTVLADQDQAPQLLPTEGGFFFGSTDYDRYYFETLEETKELLTRVLATPQIADYEIYYRSSW